MHTLTKIFTLIVWALVAAAAVTFTIHSKARPIQNFSHIANPESSSYSVTNIAQIFAAASSTNSTSTPSVTDPKLLGILHSSQSTQSRALFQSNKDLPKNYAVNGKLPNGATITQITQRSVTLSLEGRKKTLHLEKSK